MYQLALKLDHDLPFSNLSKAFPRVAISRWCNREVDILEAESQRGRIADFEKGLDDAAKKMTESVIHLHRKSDSAIEALI